jgi:hypothetical protein
MRITFVRPAAGDIDHETLWGAVLAVSVAGGAAWVHWLGLPPFVCPFRWLTGLPCPACGATHAFAALVDGHLAASLAFHPVVAPGCIVAVLYIVYAAIVVSLRLPRLRVALDGRDTGIARWAAVGAISAFWAVRIATWH